MTDQPAADGSLGEAFARLNQQQREAILALCTCPTIGAAAKKAGVTDSSIYRWLKESEEFNAAMRAYQSALLAHQLRHLEASFEAAVKVLNDLMASATREETKLSAAKAVVDTVLRARKIDLGSRLDTVERKQEEMRTDWREMLALTPAEVERHALAIQRRERGDAE